MRHQKQRTPFSHKFKHLATDFNLDSKKLHRFLQKYEIKYVKAVKEMESKKHDFNFGLSDNRTTREYIYDLCEGWIMEDILALVLKRELKDQNPNINLELNGCEVSEEGREIYWSNLKVSSQADLIIKSGAKKIKVEVQFANNDLKVYNIKETKVHQAKKDKALILVFSLALKKCFFINPNNPKDLEKGSLIRNEAWGGKETYAFKKEVISSQMGFLSLQRFAQILGGAF